MKTARFIAIVLMVQAGLCDSANAQARPRAATRPKISPYLDLTQQGFGNNGSNNNINGDVTFQYFRRVRPDVEFRNAENKLRQNLKSLANNVKMSKTQSRTSLLGTTGHAASFNTQGRYFNNGAR